MTNVHVPRHDKRVISQFAVVLRTTCNLKTPPSNGMLSSVLFRTAHARELRMTGNMADSYRITNQVHRGDPCL